MEFGCTQLQNLAAQAEVYYHEGIDIQSQKTNEQLDFEIDNEIYDDLAWADGHTNH